MNVETWLNDWYTIHAREVRRRTSEQYRDLLDRYVIPALGKIPLEDLSPAHIKHLLAQICASGHTRTAELVFVMLKCALVDLDQAPMRAIKRPRHVQVSPDAWSDDQIQVYIRACHDHPHGLALSLGLILGLRRGEICGLRWEDIDFESKKLDIRNQRQRMADGTVIDCPPKSATSCRPLPIPAPLLAQLRAARQLSGYICPLSPSGLDAAHRRLVHRLGLPYIPLHGLRHTMATSCIRHGGDMRALQAILGHASYATTANRYTHPDASMLEKALDSAALPCYNVIR